MSIIGVVGIILCINAANECEFIKFEDTDGTPPDWAEIPFHKALKGNVGIFKYAITEGYGGATPTEGCVPYEVIFGQQGWYPSLKTAQYTVLIAPILAEAGIFATMVDCCVWTFKGGYMIGSLLFFTASIVAMGPLFLVADPSFCFEDKELKCEAGLGIYFSVGATVSFFFASALLLCVRARIDPYCYNFGFEVVEFEVESYSDYSDYSYSVSSDSLDRSRRGSGRSRRGSSRRGSWRSSMS